MNGLTAALEDTSLDSIVDRVTLGLINPLVTLLLAAATVIFIWGVIQFIVNSDNAEKRGEGIRHIIWGIVGLSIMAGAAAIISIIRYSIIP